MITGISTAHALPAVVHTMCLNVTCQLYQTADAAASPAYCGRLQHLPVATEDLAATDHIKPVMCGCKSYTIPRQEDAGPDRDSGSGQAKLTNVCQPKACFSWSRILFRSSVLLLIYTADSCARLGQGLTRGGGGAAAVEWSLQKGGGVVGDLSDLAQVLKRHPATSQPVQQGPRCFCTQYDVCRRVMMNVDMRELVFTIAMSRFEAPCMRFNVSLITIIPDDWRCPYLYKVKV